MNIENVERSLLTGIEQLNPHGGKSHPSPHKPLLLVWSIRRRVVRPEADRLFSYGSTAEPMCVLLAAAGSATRPRPWYPYVRLRSSHLWELRGDVPLNAAGDAVSVRALKAPGVVAGFRAEFDPVLLDCERAAAIEDRIVSRWLEPAITSSVMAALDQLNWEA
jgi:predicted restriction endonuclease